MTTTIDAHSTGKAAKVMTAAEELILKQGFKGVTMAALAQRAHVGKGTPYLYWRTKEDLFLELITGNFADMLDDLATRVRTEADLASPEQLCAAVAETWLARPLVRALQVADVDVLGALIDDPRTHAIIAENGAAAILGRLLPVWREHATIDTGWSSEEQATALELVLVGYFATEIRGTLAAPVDRLATLQRAISAILHTTSPGTHDKAGLADEVAAVLATHAHQLRALAS